MGLSGNDNAYINYNVRVLEHYSYSKENMKTFSKNYKKQGRPTVISKHVLSELKMAYSVDSTDKEACSLAGISEKTLYNYQKKNPDFLQQKQGWKNEVILKAREQVVKAIEKDGRLALRYLEKKLPQEFGCHSLRVRYGGDDSPELQEAIKRIQDISKSI